MGFNPFLASGGPLNGGNIQTFSTPGEGVHLRFEI